MRRIFHLNLKSDNSHKYYGSLSALFKDNSELGISKFTLDRFDFEKEFYENEKCVIRKSIMKTTGQILVAGGKKKNIKNTSTKVKSKRKSSNGR